MKLFFAKFFIGRPFSRFIPVFGDHLFTHASGRPRNLLLGMKDAQSSLRDNPQGAL